MWNFLQWRKLRTENASADFQIFVGWRPKKVPKVPLFSAQREYCIAPFGYVL